LLETWTHRPGPGKKNKIKKEMNAANGEELRLI
jgi:hypothetical protein